MIAEQKNILLVEDELLIGEHISRELQTHGYKILDIITKGERVPGFILKSRPDLIIMDVNLAGQLDGIETAKIISETDNIPVIFLTANVDDQTFEKSKEAFPYAFLGKPFKIEELLRTIELVLERTENFYELNSNHTDSETAVQTTNSIFIRDKEKLVKVEFSDIQYIQADRNYSKVYTENKTFLISSPLKVVEKKINSAKLMRVHRSYMINLDAIDEMDDYYVFIKGNAIPVSKTYKQGLNDNLKFL